ncbi:MAG TPA: hypothetical protein VHY35_18425 [Stellaceae bacterium]|jgi:hypothetical protein|nr:hypothetical protein [Stellaceae bacterium]
MDQDILNSPGGDISSRENSAPAAAIAAAPLLLAEAAFSLKDIAEHSAADVAPIDNAAVLERLTTLAAGFDGDEASGVARALLQVPADLHQPLRDIFETAMRHVSGQKNIPLTPELQASLIDAIIQCLQPDKLCGIVRAEHRPIRLMIDLIDYTLDIIAAMQVMRTLWQLRGFEDLDLYSFWKPAETWVQGRAANDIGRNRFWWPTVLNMIVDYYRPQVPDRLSARYPDKQLPRATWQLDRAAFDGVARVGAQAKPPQFLLPRMSGCPCLPGRYMPDGKETTRYPNEVFTAWYRNGLVHRDPQEGPAFHSIEPNREVTKYMVDGQPHRDPDEGPAWIDTNRDGLQIEEFYWYGQLHRPAEHGPALLHKERGGNIIKEVYCEHGQRHRDPKAGPALLARENGQQTEEYSVQGALHREVEDGPAATVLDLNTGALILETYNMNGEYHRIGGPAIIATNREGQGIRSEEYFEHGQRHRPSSEGPAIWCTDSSGNIVQESYHEHGKCHRDPAQGPAWAGIQDGEHIEAYMVHGEHHRPENDGPAVTHRDPETDRVTRQEYAHDGEYHRVGGPAFIEYQPDGSPSLESWYRHGIRHRDPLDGPALIWNSDISGETYEEFFEGGMIHREPTQGPADIRRDNNGVVIRERYLVAGELHRPDGPAIVHRNPETGVIEHTEYWLHGKTVDAPPVEEIP